MKSKHLIHWLTIFTIAFVCFFTNLNTGFAEETDVAEKVEFVKGRLMFDRVAKVSYFDVSLKNISEDVILAPIKVVIDSISVPDVKVMNASGNTDDGKPYYLYNAPDDLLQSNASTTASKFTFYNPKQLKFTYTVSVLQGTVGEMRPVTEDEIVTDPETGVKYVIGQILLTPVSGISRQEVDQLVESRGGRIIGYLKYVELYQVIFPEYTLDALELMIDDLNQDGNIEAAIINRVANLDTLPNDPWAEESGARETWQVFPWMDKIDIFDSDNVPKGNNASLESMRLPEAWNSAYLNGVYKKSPLIGIIDSDFPVQKLDKTGSNLSILHEDFKYPNNAGVGFLWVNESGNKFQSNNDKENFKMYQHGHHVAGIIGARANNDQGIAGVVWGAKLLGYRIGTSVEDSNIYQGIAKLILEKNAGVVNLSMGNNITIEEGDSLLDVNDYFKTNKFIRNQIRINESFFRSLIRANPNFLVVQSAGNDRLDAIANGFAASVVNDQIKKNIIIVGSYGTTFKDVPLKNNYVEYFPAEKSNYGSTVDIYAPGETFRSRWLDELEFPKVYSTIYTYSDSANSGVSSYLHLKGTSQAAPYITGLAALLKQQYSISYNQVKQAILKGATGQYVNDIVKHISPTNPIGTLTPMPIGEIKIANALDAVHEAINYEKYAEVINSPNTEIQGFIAYYKGLYKGLFNQNGYNIYGNWISWRPYQGNKVITKYRIYWGNDASVSKTNKSGVLETNSLNTSYHHTEVIPGQTYYYRICYVDANEIESPLSYMVESYVPTYHSMVETNSDQDEEVIFPDPNLEALIRETINKPTDPILKSDLLLITELGPDPEGDTSGSRNIEDLRGLENCANLTFLSLYNNKITDISPLSTLVNLKHLLISSNQISDISPLANLINLETLTLHYNQISDISPLVNLVNMDYLLLHYNQISDVNPLTEMANLRYLYLDSNQINDISPLSNFVNLEVLSLYSNQISEISSLADLTNLRSLNLGNNPISDISSLAELTKLNQLSLRSNQISDISSLKYLVNLRSLNLFSNSISNISSLTTLVNLSDLGLTMNQVNDISLLENLVNLESLQLGANKISDISVLENFTNLRILVLDVNQIIDISPLSNLENLKYLYVAYNQITNASPLINNSGINSGDTLRIQSNPLDTVSCQEYIPQLIARGVNVYHSCQ